MMNAESIISALDAPVLVLDGSLRAVLANPAFYGLVRIRPGQLAGKTVQELVREGGDQPGLQEVLETVVASGNSKERVEVEYVLPPAAEKTFLVGARRVFDEKGNGVMVLVEFRDITQHKATERRLEELNEALQHQTADLKRINADLEAFNRWVSHDLRTPLRFMNATAHQLLDQHDAELSPSVKHAVRMILKCTGDMGQLIESLLGFTQLDRVPVKKRRVDPGRIARGAWKELKPHTEDRSVEMTAGALPLCNADPALLKQVFLNLLANALTFTQPCERAEIEVGSMLADGATVYFVRDNGAGFEMDEADSIFLPFHRLHRKQPLQGTGIGLTLVKRIVERHGGRIWAEGEPSRGATFYFHLGE